MPPEPIKTARLTIRPFIPDDTAVIHRILNHAFGVENADDDPAALDQRRSWVRWSQLSQEWLPAMHQPPYGDRAVVLTASGALIGAVGYVPCLAPFGQLPGFAPGTGRFATPEVGLFWAIDPAHQRQGYAAEAAHALIDHAFGELRLRRIIATTEHANLASQAVMRKLGMRLERNPLPDPAWLQVVGVLDNPGGAPDWT